MPVETSSAQQQLPLAFGDLQLPVENPRGTVEPARRAPDSTQETMRLGCWTANAVAKSHQEL